MGSTMDAAHALAQEGVPHGTAIIAAEQTGARGQRGRAWASPVGGLWASVVTRPSRSDALGALSLRVGLAVAAALEAHHPALPLLGLKWPNDLLLGERKLGGILAEARWADGRCLWAVVGVGINVRNPMPAHLAEYATRLADTVPEAEVEGLVDPILAAIAEAATRAGPLSSVERAAFAARDTLRGREVREPVLGVADGVAADGALLIRSADGHIHHCVAGVVPAPT